MTDKPNFFESTGYGTGGGLCGWNCRHNFIPFNPKYMSNNLKQYGLEENKESYELSQKQRNYERRIRNTKRKISIIKNSLNVSSNEQLNKELNNIQNKTIKNITIENLSKIIGRTEF